MFGNVSFNWSTSWKKLKCVCQVWIFVILLPLINGITKQNYMIGAIHVKKLGMDLIKNIINIGVELVCVFPKLFFHWELFVAKWFRQKEYQNA